jgi:hypothetical protein
MINELAARRDCDARESLCRESSGQFHWNTLARTTLPALHSPRASRRRGRGSWSSSRSWLEKIQVANFSGALPTRQFTHSRVKVKSCEWHINLFNAHTPPFWTKTLDINTYTYTWARTCESSSWYCTTLRGYVRAAATEISEILE